MSGELRTWLLGPADLDAIRHDDTLLAALAAGEAPDPDDPLAAHLVAWLAEVDAGGAR